MFNKINVLNIIRNHFETWIDDSTGNKSYGDFFLFLGAPLLIAALLTFVFYIELNGELISLLATTLSIVTALLFNLLILIFDISGKNEDKLRDRKTRLAEFLKQIYTNISFSILISILAVIFVILASFDFWPLYIIKVFSFFVFFLVTVFLLTLFMVLKRIDILLYEEFRKYQ